MLRNLILRLMPGSWRDWAIAESRAWKTKCRSCGAESDILALGGLRAGGRGNKVIRTRCPTCGKFTGHDMHKASA